MIFYDNKGSPLMAVADTHTWKHMNTLFQSNQPTRSQVRRVRAASAFQKKVKETVFPKSTKYR